MLETIARQGGVAIGWEGAPLERGVAAIRGRLRLADVLRRALAGSGWDAMRTGETSWRLIRKAGARTAGRRPPNELPAPTLAADIVVTGQKRAHRLWQSPGSIGVVRPDQLSWGRISPGSRDAAAQVEGLAFTNLGPGRNRAFIRGVADSPFNGSSQSTVAVVLDEARITFDAPDPDIRLVDVEQVEVLKGPQGPLYGSGAIGGIYRITTVRPDLATAGGSVRAAVSAIQHGSPGTGVDAVLNLPVIGDTLGIRAVGYAAREGGWIDDRAGRRDGNAVQVAGGRLALRWRPDATWLVDASGMIQDVLVRDSQYVTASRTALDRDARFREPTDNDFKEAALTVAGRIGGWFVTATSSYVRQGLDVDLDASDAAARLGLPAPALFRDRRRYVVRNHELRVSPAVSGRWLVGVSWLGATSRTSGTAESVSIDRVVETADREVGEVAVFGEGDVRLAPGIALVGGVRLSRTVLADETTEEVAGQPTPGASRRVRQIIASPSLAVTWVRGQRGTAYARYARAVRPGGLAPSGATAARRFDADELGTLDLGYRWRSPGRSLSFAGSAFHTEWSDVQSDYLLTNGLVSTRNAGRGRIVGAEVEAEWSPGAHTTIELGTTWVDAQLVRSADDLELDDRRLPVTPDVTARVAVRRRFELGSWAGSAYVQANYLGRARLSFDEDLGRRMGGYAIGTVATSLFRNGVTLDLRLDNLLDVRGDSFAFGNPFSIRNGPQYTPVRPRTVTLSATVAW